MEKVKCKVRLWIFLQWIWLCFWYFVKVFNGHCSLIIYDTKKRNYENCKLLGVKFSMFNLYSRFMIILLWQSHAISKGQNGNNNNQNNLYKIRQWNHSNERRNFDL